jgi:hypothetical protein
LAPNGFDDVERVLSYAKREAIVKAYAGKAGFVTSPASTRLRRHREAQRRHRHPCASARARAERPDCPRS